MPTYVQVDTTPMVSDVDGDTIPGDFGVLKERCPKCGGEIHERYREFKCITENCPFYVRKAMSGRMFEYEEVEQLIREKQIGPLTGFRNKMGRPFNAMIKLNAELAVRWPSITKRKAALPDADEWKDVKDKLKQSGMALSGGQQQRLCIARTIAIEPEVILMDEPCSALDPIATARIEELMDELKENFTIVIVTHNMQQAARVSQRTAFFHLGNLVEFGDTDEVFSTPQDKRTQDYITGRFG